ncbi:PREDICTED: H/ACA ribonucleoprotein complex non-core subunit NAF1 [Wasmannia auropunctata]|uniref:H/ACA ribonucleoprotein complex non-core subunit NAF1 n=1 Tax=Wasmannia auropunctata TaxID=64793 RepID=UPI0005F0131C|nr:PREDICTED: H/ACA ribonucleoprotein complex non-core subunit NAF1 [Wasmannia auropunctata]
MRKRLDIKSMTSDLWHVRGREVESLPLSTFSRGPGLCVEMEVTIDVDANKVVDEEIPTNEIPTMSTSKENTEVFQPGIELLTSQQLAHGENSLKEECEETIQLDKRSFKEKDEAMFSEEKLENETIVVAEKGTLINRENECDMSHMSDTSITLDANKIENASNSYDVSADIQDIVQSMPKENDETSARKCYTAADENTSDARYEVLQRSPEIMKCQVSNDTDIVQNRDINDQIIEQSVTVNLQTDDTIVSNSSLQKQDKIEFDGESSLDVIAKAYEGMDSNTEEMETDATIENQHTVPQTQNLQQYRTEGQLRENTDSQDDSSSDSSSSSSSSCSSSRCSISSDNNSDSDSDDANIDNRKKGSEAKPAKKKNDVENELDKLPPIEDLKISVPEDLCNPLGKIEKIVEQLVVVKPNPGEPTLDLDTVLFVNKGTKALGHVFDVFGSVKEPHYCVRFNDAKHIQDNDIEVGMQVYYCPLDKSYTHLVFMHELTKIKACDTVDDDEPPQFSDDEEEQAYYANLKQKNNKNYSNGRKRQRRMSPHDNATVGWRSNHPWNQNRRVQSPRCNWNRQQSWGDRSNSAQNGTYSYNESWNQYPYQNNAYWQPFPQNVYPMSNGYPTEPAYAGPPYTSYGPHYGANQCYQGINYQFPAASYSSDMYASTSFYTQPPVSTTNTYWSQSISPSTSSTVNSNTDDPNSSK